MIDISKDKALRQYLLEKISSRDQKNTRFTIAKVGCPVQ